jgi:DNA-binding PadR family transcriptional regulator
MFHRHFFEFEQSRMFEKGDLKYVILDLLNDKPRHGYEIIRELERRFHGFYSPSAGSVYPTLQLLEDMGYLKSAEQDGKKIYTITEEGKRFLDERGETISKIKDNLHNWWGTANRDDLRETAREFRGIAHKIRSKLYRLDSEKLSKIRGIITKTGNDIEDILNK